MDNIWWRGWMENLQCAYSLSTIPFLYYRRCNDEPKYPMTHSPTSMPSEFTLRWSHAVGAILQEGVSNFEDSRWANPVISPSTGTEVVQREKTPRRPSCLGMDHSINMELLCIAGVMDHWVGLWFSLAFKTLDRICRCSFHHEMSRPPYS